MSMADDVVDEFGVGHPAAGRSHVRYKVLAFGVAMAAITYLDRVCIAQTAPAMMRDLGLTKVQMGLVFSAFTLAYGLFEIPTGAWGDRIGTRRVLARIVVWWSTFTVATAAAFSYGSLLAIRFLFGIGEAGAWPNIAKTFSCWFPTSERGTAQGITGAARRPHSEHALFALEGSHGARQRGLRQAAGSCDLGGRAHSGRQSGQYGGTSRIRSHA